MSVYFPWCRENGCLCFTNTCIATRLTIFHEVNWMYIKADEIKIPILLMLSPTHDFSLHDSTLFYPHSYSLHLFGTHSYPLSLPFLLLLRLLLLILRLLNHPTTIFSNWPSSSSSYSFPTQPHSHSTAFPATTSFHLQPRYSTTPWWI